MQENSPTAVLKAVHSFRRDAGVADIVCDTVDGQQVTLKVDIRYLWAIAADLRLASIDLLAPVPEALRAALGSQSDEEEETEADKKGAEAAGNDGETPKSGYPGLEQAWTLCDALNDAPMFAEFPRSVGVANIDAVWDELEHKPNYLTQASEGAGVRELVDHLLG